MKINFYFLKVLETGLFSGYAAEVGEQQKHKAVSRILCVFLICGIYGGWGNLLVIWFKNYQYRTLRSHTG